MKQNKITLLLTALLMGIFTINCASESTAAASGGSCTDAANYTFTGITGNTLSGCEYSGLITVSPAAVVTFSGVVKITNSLTIGAGAIIKADANAAIATTVIIDRGAVINANGTIGSPIVFTSSNSDAENAYAANTAASGDWGGLVINGYAPVNLTGGTGIGEGSSGTYGGTNVADNSGTLSYVRVEYSGKLFSTENELNGIALQGVGNGTTIDNLHVHKAKDDGLEFFGGSVDAKHVIISYAQDDQFDWTSGWNGQVQYLVLIHSAGSSADPRGIEGDNLSTNFAATPRSAPKIWNVSIFGDKKYYKDIIKLRRGTDATIGNLYIANQCGMKINLESDETINRVTTDGATYSADTTFANPVKIIGMVAENVDTNNAEEKLVGFGTVCGGVVSVATTLTAMASGSHNAINNALVPPAGYAWDKVNLTTDVFTGTNVISNALTAAGPADNSAAVAGGTLDATLGTTFLPTTPDTLSAADPLLHAEGNNGVAGFFTAGTYIGAFSATNWASWTKLNQ
jgi:hypothetical protein